MPQTPGYSFMQMKLKAIKFTFLLTPSPQYFSVRQPMIGTLKITGGMEVEVVGLNIQFMSYRLPDVCISLIIPDTTSIFILMI